MNKLYKVLCEVNMCSSERIEVIVETKAFKRAIHIAENQLKDEGYSYVNAVSCKEV